MSIAWIMAAALVAQDAPQTPPPAAVPAQDAEAGEGETGEEIVVTGSRRPRGSVIGDIPPDQTFSPADIRSYGVNSVADLLTEFAPQTRSGRGGPPVVLLNGRRISGFQEIRDLPTEAIQRVEVLPEEVALKYGYRADSRVVNIVLRRRFRSAVVELADRIPTSGGRQAPQAELDLLNIQRDGRTSLGVEYRQASALTEAERGILPRSGDDATTPAVDQTPFRTLLPRTRNFSANVVHARPLLGAQATANAQIELSNSESQFGLPLLLLDREGVNPLAQRSDSITAHLGAAANGQWGDWQWSLTGNYDRVESETLTETGLDAAGNPLAANRARSVSSIGAGDLLFAGSPFRLPAGPVTASFRAGASTTDFRSRSFRTGLTQAGNVSRDLVNTQANIDLPILRDSPVLGALSVNGNGQVERLSDFGTLLTTGYGVNWGPLTGVRLIASVTDEENAPSPSQLGAPIVTTPNARVFDFTRGLTATVTTVTGGNPLLREDNRHVERIGLTLKPWTATDLTLTANYTATTVDDPVRSFPAALPVLERAFPQRFLRDANGNLLSIDTRPVNLGRSERQELRWGVNFSKPIRSQIQRQLEAFRAGTGPNPFVGLRPPGGGQPGGQPGGRGEDRRAREGSNQATGQGGGQGARGQGGGRGGFGGGGFGGRGGGQGGGGRLQFALYHTYAIRDRLRLAEGGPELDLLGGDAIGSGGGQSRHELEGQAGYTNNGIGARLSVNYRSATSVNGLTDADDLRFGGLATANLRLFVDAGGRIDWVRRRPWLRGVRVALAIDNIFNQRQRVTDSLGATPISYQPGYLDPLGRSVRLSVRKLFF